MANFTSQSVNATYQRLLQVESGSVFFDGTGSRIVNADLTSSYANTASYFGGIVDNAISSSYISGSQVIVGGMLSAISSSAAPICGNVVLSSGTANVSSSAVKATSIVLLTGGGGTITNLGTVYCSAKVPATSFTITSTNILDAQTVSWFLINSI